MTNSLIEIDFVDICSCLREGKTQSKDHIWMAFNVYNWFIWTRRCNRPLHVVVYGASYVLTPSIIPYHAILERLSVHPHSCIRPFVVA